MADQIVEGLSKRGQYISIRNRKELELIFSQGLLINGIVGNSVNNSIVNPSVNENGYAIIWDNDNEEYTLSNILSSGNGITIIGSSVNLGGSLTANVNIQATDYSFNIYVEDTTGASGNGAYIEYNTNIGNGENHFLNINKNGIDIFSTSSDPDFNNWIGIYSGQIQVGLGGVSVFQYADDYSANYTNRSLVDKEYVDNAILAALP